MGADGLQQLTAVRSVPSRDGPGPCRAELAEILLAATTVPDHGGLRPWRFVVIEGNGREQFGQALVAGLIEGQGAPLPDSVIAKMRSKAFAGPCLIMVIATPKSESNVPRWEQISSASCTGYAMVLAASALGYGAIWKSASVLQSQPVRRLVDVEEDDEILGWIVIGTADSAHSTPRDRGEIQLDALVTTIDDRGAQPWTAQPC